MLRKGETARRGPADPQAALAAFAKDLRDLRARAGLWYPEMAELSHYTMKTLAAAAGGLRLPTLPVTVAFVRACGGDIAEWEDRWQRLAAVLGPSGDREAGGQEPPAGRGQSSQGPPPGPAGQAREQVRVITSAGPHGPCR